MKSQRNKLRKAIQCEYLVVDSISARETTAHDAHVEMNFLAVAQGRIIEGVSRCGAITIAS